MKNAISMSLLASGGLPAVSKPLNIPPPSIALSGANLTTKWIDNTDLHQVLELWVTNTDSKNFLTASHQFSVGVDCDSLITTEPGEIIRLAPGQHVKVQIGVKNKDGVAPGSTCKSKVVAYYGNGDNAKTASGDVSGSCGIPDYLPTTPSLGTHVTSDWFDNLKYGIFIHWGIYSVPGWGNIGDKENYAEWYWMWMQNKQDKTQTYQYHLDHYGANFNYDQFIANFTGKGFDAKSWVDLFADAGAQYFVPTTKHHEGWALFNTSSSVSRRSVSQYGPKRDFLKELFDASKKYQPHLRRGTYFSLPEFFNANYGKLPGAFFTNGAPKNPYTGKQIEYTGDLNHSDFIRDLQAPQMRELAYNYETEMMWCDIGGPNNSSYVLSEWINWAKAHGRQVVFNSRCGEGTQLPGDFTTPEYAPNPDSPLEKKWESSRGMDPHSYGYNRATPDAAYLTGEGIVTTLVDIVANNGNFLLDIGPRGDGSIPEIMQKNLRDAGEWINDRPESIFNTTYWTATAGKDKFRYTTNQAAFFIHYIGAPPKELAITDPIPYLPGDKITVLGGSQDGVEVPASWTSIGTLKLHLDDKMIAGDKYVWTFKIEYGYQ